MPRVVRRTRSHSSGFSFRAIASRSRSNPALFRLLTPERRAGIGPALPGLLLEWARAVRASGDDAETHTLLESAYGWGIAYGHHGTSVEAAGELAAAHALAGRTVAVRLWIDRATALHRANTGDPDVPMAARFASAVLAGWRLDLATAIRLLDECGLVPSIDADVFVSGLRALWLGQGGAGGAEARAGFERLVAGHPPRSDVGRLVAQLVPAYLDLRADRPFAAAQNLVPDGPYRYGSPPRAPVRTSRSGTPRRPRSTPRSRSTRSPSGRTATSRCG